MLIRANPFASSSCEIYEPARYLVLNMAEDRRDSFREFLQTLSAKQNSKLISEVKAIRIRRVLASRDGKHARDYSPRFRFYVHSKRFVVIDLPVLGLKEVLCLPAPKVRCV